MKTSTVLNPPKLSRSPWALVLTVLCLIACENPPATEEQDRPCAKGAAKACELDGCERALRLCAGSPLNFQACQCDDPVPEPDAGSHQDTRPELGTACDQDTDCPARAFCLQPTLSSLFGGAPVEGLCVASCLTAVSVCDEFKNTVCVDTTAPEPAPAQALPDAGELDAGSLDAGSLDAGQFDAGQLDAGSLDGAVPDAMLADAAVPDAAIPDLSPEPTALCLPRCTVGGGESCPSTAAPAANQACHAVKPGSAEPPVESMGGYCRPLCTVNKDCPQEYACDPATGSCKPNKQANASDIGQACQVSQVLQVGESPCAGLCVAQATPKQASYATCSTRCVFGSASDCAPASPRTPGGGCIIATAGGGIGDLGYCGQLCDCAGDCSHPDAICDAFNDDTLERIFGRKGSCTSPAMALGEGLRCGR